jgi:hypothetical protein
MVASEQPVYDLQSNPGAAGSHVRFSWILGKTNGPSVSQTAFLACPGIRISTAIHD